MKKILPALLLIAIAFVSATAIAPSHAATTATLGIDSSTQQFPTATVGSTIVVNLTISNIQGLWAWDIESFEFNPNILSLVSVNEGPFLTQAGQTLFLYPSGAVNAINNGTIPEISDTLLEDTSVSGSGVIVSFDFTVVALGTCDITFGQVLADGPPQGVNVGASISISGVNGAVTVGAASSNPTPSASSPSNSPTSSPATSDSPGDNPSPTATSTTTQAPEIPVVPTIALLAVFVAVCALLALAKKKRLNKN